MDFIKTLLISCIPAIITGAVTYLVAYKNATAQIKVIEEQNKHDLDKLMEQHKIDIDDVQRMLDAKDKSACRYNASSCGLYLVEVKYNETN